MNPLPFQVFSCSASRYFAEKICASLGCELGKSTYTRFSDGE
ncbi:MAG: ribose-phosphate pyrophosphokinase-like domain-containing protein, partial [Paludibacteraceae bacterium]|nr:ribose-phosphate pyrophosphokinase-like domain-containing protein [Paludibacteraceae bacterium]